MRVQQLALTVDRRLEFVQVGVDARHFGVGTLLLLLRDEALEVIDLGQLGLDLGWQPYRLRGDRSRLQRLSKRRDRVLDAAQGHHAQG